MAKISVNGLIVLVETNEHGNYRGLHMVVVNPSNGGVEWARVFDTYESADSFENHITYEIPEGYIVVAACKDDCAANLSKYSRQWFANMGSREIWNLEYR